MKPLNPWKGHSSVFLSQESGEGDMGRDGGPKLQEILGDPHLVLLSPENYVDSEHSRRWPEDKVFSKTRALRKMATDIKNGSDGSYPRSWPPTHCVV